MMSTSAMRTGLATAFVACGVVAGPQLAAGQARMVALSVPVRLVTAGCTLSTPAGGSADMLMNCGGIITTSQGVGGMAAVGGAVRTSTLTGSSALSVMSVSSAARGSYGSATVAGWVNPTLSGGASPAGLGPATIAPANAVEPSGAGSSEPSRDPSRPRSGPEGSGDEEAPAPVPGELSPGQGEPADAHPTFRHAVVAAHSAQISRVQMNGHVQMLVVF